MNIKIKPMKLQFIRNNDVWDKVITTLDGSIVYEQRGLILNAENINKEYFDNWESQLKKIPIWNIVEVERFI